MPVSTRAVPASPQLTYNPDDRWPPEGKFFHMGPPWVFEPFRRGHRESRARRAANHCSPLSPRPHAEVSPVFLWPSPVSLSRKTVFVEWSDAADGDCDQRWRGAADSGGDFAAKLSAERGDHCGRMGRGRVTFDRWELVQYLQFPHASCASFLS